MRIKFIFFIFIYFSVVSGINGDTIDDIFNDAKLMNARIIRNTELIENKLVGNAFRIGNQKFIYQQFRNDTLEVVYSDFKKKIVLLSEEENIPFYESSIFLNENQDKVVFSFRSSEKGSSIYFGYFFDLENGSYRNVTDKILTEQMFPIRYWKHDLFNYEAQNKYGKYKAYNYVDIFIDDIDDNYSIRVMDKSRGGSEYIIKKVYTKGSIYEKWKPLFIGSYNYGFVSLPDFNSNEFHTDLYSVSPEAEIVKRDVMIEFKLESFEIVEMENSFMEQDYLILFAKNYKKYDKENPVNYMIIIRKSDFKIRCFPIIESDIKTIDIIFGQYMIFGNSINLMNRQKNYEFYTLQLE